MIKKILLCGIASLVLTTSANAWLIDGDNYAGININVGAGKAEESTVFSQSVGIEFGRQMSPNFYGGIVAKYNIFSLKDTTLTRNKFIGTAAGVLEFKGGYTFTKSFMLYATGGYAQGNGLNSAVLGGGARYAFNRSSAFFVEYKQYNVLLENVGGARHSSVLGSGVVGFQFFLRY